MIKEKGKAVIQNASKTSKSEKVLRQVAKVHRSKKSRDWGYALLVGAAVLAVTMLLAMFVESQLNLFSHAFRFVLTALSLVATVVCTWSLWRRGKRNNERLVSAAKDIDSAYPRLEQRISTLTSCKEDVNESQQSVHPAMLRRLTQETVEMHQEVKPKPIVSYGMFRLPLICLACAGLVLAGLFALDAPKTLVQLGRFFAPWSELSTTTVESVEGNLVAARNEPLKLTASMAGRPVDEVLFLSKKVDGSDSSTSRLWPSAKDNTVATFRQSKALQSFDFRFRTGDGQTPWHRVTVADRPKIEDLTMRVVPPEYTGKPAKTFQQRLPKKLRVVQGTRLEVEVKPESGVRTARLVMGKTDWLPMELSTDGKYDGSLDLRQPVNFEVQLTELHGLVNRRPPTCQLKVVADQAPKVKILKPTKTRVLLPDEAIDIHFKASDDHGIQKMALRVYTQRKGEKEAQLHEVEIPLDPESDNRKVKGSVELDLAQFDLKDGDSIRYEIRASDNFVPQEDEESDLLPMKDVELEKANDSLVDNKGASDDAPPTPQDPKNPSVASATSKGNANDAASESDSSAAKANEAAPKDAVAQSDSPTPNQNADQQPADSTADPNDSPQNSAEDIASNENKIGKPGTPGTPKPADDNTGADSTQDIASNENKTGTPKPADLAADDTSKDSAPSTPSTPSATPNSDQAMKPNSQENSQENSQADSLAKGSQSASESKTPSDNNASSGQSSQASQSQQANSSSKNNSETDPSKSDSDLAAKEDKPDASKEDEQDSTTPDEAEKMAARSSDKGQQGQSSSTGQQKIKVDKYAGGFTSEHRKRLEIDIAPTLELLKKSLDSAGKSVREVMMDPNSFAETNAKLTGAAADLKTGSDAVFTLTEKTTKTPYAFVGLRLESIRAADITPAHGEVLKAVETQDEQRLQHSSVAWNHIDRALASIEKLEQKYDEVRRELKRADDILAFKKVYSLYIEKAMMAFGQSGGAMNGQNRKQAEFELDEEYLKRLKEVLELQQEMRAELARILEDDPQLLRRHINRMNDRAVSIRDQLSLAANAQRQLTEEVVKWSSAKSKPLELADHNLDAIEGHLAEIEGLANRLGDVQNQFISWLPLVESAQTGEAAEAVEQFKAAGVGLTEIVAEVETIFEQGGAQANAKRQIEPILAKSTKVENQLSLVAESLQQLNSDSTDPEIVNNTARRIPVLQSLRRDMQQWAGKLELHGDGLIHEVYSVDQENRREELLMYSVKIASLESQLVSALSGTDSQMPDGVAEKTVSLQKQVDAEIPSSQLLAAQTLENGNSDLASLQQQEIMQDFEKAEKTFDEILQAIADELDKIEPEDPIAALLRDPTLDEILAQLEREMDFMEQLGLSRRPTNLMFFGGFRPFMNRSMSASLSSQLQQMRRLTNRAYRKALARARVENEARKPVLAKDNERWNLLASVLGDAMRQGDKRTPPEKYRRAIEHYTDQISKLKNAQQENE